MVISNNIEAALTEKTKVAARLSELKDSLNDDHSLIKIKQEIAVTKVEVKEVEVSDVKVEVKKEADDGDKCERIVGLKNLRKHMKVRDESEFANVHSNDSATPETSYAANGLIKSKIKMLMKSKTLSVDCKKYIELNKDENNECKLIINIR
jgi:hypothetical protein